MRQSVIRPDHDGFQLDGRRSARSGNDRGDFQRIQTDVLGPALPGRNGYCNERQQQGHPKKSNAYWIAH
jgi:hypothetical protein